MGTVQIGVIRLTGQSPSLNGGGPQTPWASCCPTHEGEPNLIKCSRTGCPIDPGYPRALKTSKS
jgi:hypothetical protein